MTTNQLPGTQKTASRGTRRARRAAVAATLIGATLIAGSTVPANAASGPRGSTCVGSADFYRSSHTVTFSPFCSEDDVYKRLAIWDGATRRWMWSNWTDANPFGLSVLAFNGVQSLGRKVYIQFAWYENGDWQYDGDYEWVGVHS